jgi:TetR/AcrR family transcriptional regulator, regulator of biofilm formation and stress response
MTRPADGKRRNPRRQEILEATLRVIGHDGVNGVTHRAVAQEANVSLASTTYYFDSKRALVEEALELMIARSTESVRRHTTTPARISRAQLVERIVAFAGAQTHEPDALLTAQYELMLESGRAEYLRALARRWNIAYMDGFTRMMRSAGIPRPKVAAEIIMSFVEGALLDQVATPRADFLDGYFRPLLNELVTAWYKSNPGHRRARRVAQSGRSSSRAQR